MALSSPTLYERLGGERAIEAVIGDFYDRVLADPLLAPFFEGIERDRLRRMQREFFAAALGGPIRYTGRPLNVVHAGLGIRTRHLARFLEHLTATLADRELTERDRYDIYTRIHRYADEITGTTSVDG
ncbi:MAG: group 1 truncated hemoglobin [Myxococcota bacterium]